MSLLKITATTLFLACATTASAATIWDESIDGDFDGVAGTTLGNILAAGTNTILGSLPGTPSGGSSHTDRFNLVLGAGLNIVAWTLNIQLENGESVNTGLGYNPGNLFDDNFTSNVTGTTSASFADTTGPDTGTLDGSLANSVWDFSVNAGTLYGTQSYSIDIVTRATTPPPPPPPPTAVPLPASAPLFIAALGGLAALRRRAKRKAAR